MKRFYFLLTAFVMLSVSAWAQTYQDVTATYLKNADFGSGPVATTDVFGYGKDKGDAVYSLQAITDWTISDEYGYEGDGFEHNGVGGAVFAYGSTNVLKGEGKSAPASGPDGATGNALGFFAVWSTSGYYYQNVTLPTGSYTITYQIYNQSGTTAPATSYFGFLADDGTNHVVKPSELTTVGAWQTRKVKFTLPSSTTGKIAIGYKSGGGGSGANPHLFVDNVTIEYSNIGEDYTEYITNPSFEQDGSEKTGAPTGWQTTGGSDVGLGGSTKWDAAGKDGTYLFNIWGGTAPRSVYQDIVLPAGNYVLYASIANDAGGFVSLFAGDQYKNISLNNNAVLEPINVYFTQAAEGTVRIGVSTENSWFKCDDFRLFKLDDDTELTPTHFETASGDWNVSGGTATLDAETPYYISKDDRYIVAQVSGVGTAIGNTKLTTLNNEAEGHYPTYTWTIGGDTYFVWDIEASRFSLWYTLGDNLSLGTANTQLSNGSTVFTFSGTPSITSIYTTKNITDDLATAKAYAELTELIAAAKELNTKLDDESTIAASIAIAEEVIANGGNYSQMRSDLLTAIRKGLPNAATEVDVTDIYIRNNSFETGWAAYWVPADFVTPENRVRELELWGRDGSYIYNQKDGDNIAGSLVQNISNLAAGKYQLSAAVCGANGENVTVKFGDATVSANAFTDDKDGKTITTEAASVSDNVSIQIGVVTTNSWFKADNFRLTYLPSTGVDKTDLRRMILTAENLVKLGEGNDASLNNLSTYTELANNESASAAAVEAAVNELRTKIQSSYDAYNKDKRPTASAAADGEFFLYNVATKSYLNFGSQWGTRAIANDYRGEAGTLLKLEHPTELEAGRYTIKTNSIWNKYGLSEDDADFTVRYLVALTRDGVWIDGDPTKTTKKTVNGGNVVDERLNDWAVMPWKFEEVPGLEGRNVYRLYRTSGDERDYGLTPGTLLKKVMTLDHMETEGDDIMISTLDADGVLNDLNSYWMLVSKDYRDGLLDAANLANPVNASYNIKNPDLEGFNQGPNGADKGVHLGKVWNRSSDNASVAVGAPTATSTWADCGVQIYDYARTSLSQTITLPKAGLYRLRVNGFYRPGFEDRFEANTSSSGGFNPASNYAAIRQHKGEVAMNAYLYADDQQVPLMSINTGDKGTVLPFGTATDDKQNVSGFFNNARFADKYKNVYFDYGHVPNSVGAGADRFREDNGEGRYSDNSLLVYVPEGDLTLTIGVKKDGMFTKDWALYDHFNIWYLGNNGSAEFAKAYNDYRKARIDAINVLFDTYHYTELRDTAYTRYLNENGFELTTKYGSPMDHFREKVDVWNEGDPKGTTVFALWLQDQLKKDDELVAGLMTGSSADAEQLKNVTEALDYDVAVAKLAYQMAEFYFFSRGVQQFYAVASDGSSQMIGDGNKSDVIDPLKASVDRLVNIDLRTLNTLKKAMGVGTPNEAFVMGKDAITVLTDSLTTIYADPSTLAMNNVKPSTNSVKDPIKANAVAAARVLTPPTRAEFDLTFMLPRADVIGLEQWDWLPVFEWLSDDDPAKSPYNYDIHSTNNTYKEHNGYFAERWRASTEGLDEGKWAIYQNLKLPVGLYRFSAATFARYGGEDSETVAKNAYIAMNLASADSATVRPAATLIPTIKLDDISTFYEIVNDNVDDEKLADVNVGMYIGKKETVKPNIASWIGMSQMRLYKIPEVTISEDKVYRVGLNADGHGNGYSNDSEHTGDAYEYWPVGEESSHAEEVDQNPYLFNISPAARITGVKRTFKAGTWQTLTLPFDMSRQEFLDMLKIKDVVINQFTGSRVRHYEDWSVSHPDDKLGARVDLYFERETGDKKDSIYAHRPCLVWIPEDAGLETPTWDVGTWYKPGSVEIVRAKEASYWPDKADFQRYSGDDGVYMAEFSFDACYAGVNVGEKYGADGKSTATNDGLGSYLPETSYYISGNEFKYVPRKSDWDKYFSGKPYNPVRSKGLRGYFTYHGDSEAVQQGKIGVWSYEFDTGNGTDKIELNNFGEVIGRQINGRDVTGVYNINGQLLRKDGSSLEGLSKGVYIVNGNKVIIK